MNISKGIIGVAVAAVFFGAGAACFLTGMQNGEKSTFFKRTEPRMEKSLKAESEQKKTITALGRVRGRSQMTLRNKYAGFVSKVNYYSQRRVKKGDVILEYDDLELQKAIKKVEHSIAEQQKLLARKKHSLYLTRLDPLPSEYRNLYWKQKKAVENLEKAAHEYDVYQRLHGSKIVTDLAFREKKEAFKKSEAEVKQIDNDMRILKKGLADLYVKMAEMEVEEAEIRLRNLQDELVLLRSEQKYYRITAPYDGLCITNSDTVHGYNSAGTNAAEVHRDDRKLIYAYFQDQDICHVREGMTARFISNQYPDDKQGAELRAFKVESSRTIYGNNIFFLVEFHVVKEPYPLRIGSLGTVEITLE